MEKDLDREFAASQQVQPQQHGRQSKEAAAIITSKPITGGHDGVSEAPQQGQNNNSSNDQQQDPIIQDNESDAEDFSEPLSSPADTDPFA